MKVLNLEEIKDILIGCTILGTGGGGALEEGMELCVFGAPCHELWKTERALEILNPGFFGFDMECKFLDNKE